MTGYTDEACNKKMDFKQFAMLCARAFGATIMMRDDSLDKPIPEAFSPDTYHVKAVKEAREKIKKLEAMNEAQRLKYGEDKKKEIIAHCLGRVEEAKSRVEYMESLLQDVQKWTPPTSEHENMKKFMVDQLESSIKGEYIDYYSKQIEDTKKTNALELYERDLKDAKESITYHLEHDAKEKALTESRNKWIAELRKSL